MLRNKDELQVSYNQLLTQLGLLQLNKVRNVQAIDKQMGDLVDQCMTLEKEAEQLVLVEKATQEALAKALEPQPDVIDKYDAQRGMHNS